MERAPSVTGLLGFSTCEEAVDGLDRIVADYQRHAAAAQRIAYDCFDAARVLPPLLETALS
jgi:hypothetical protein